jgi:hypothetical protein
MGEVQKEIHLVWLEVHTFPSKFKLSKIRVRSRNHNKIDYRHLSVINLYEASIYNLEWLVNFTAAINSRLVQVLI